MIFKAIRNIFVENNRALNMRVLQRLCLEKGQWMVLNSQYSASRKNYFFFWWTLASSKIVIYPVSNF
jgi:hypothetical protein